MSHGIDSMFANFNSQEIVKSRITSFSGAYDNFIKLGGSSSICSTLFVKSGSAIKNMSFLTSVFCNLMIEALRPNSYEPTEPLEDDSIVLSGCILKELF